MNTARKFTLILIFLICAAALGGLLFLRVTEMCIRDSRKAEAFGFEVYEIDGHDMVQIVEVFDKIRAAKNGKPKFINAHTVKGKGVDYMENNLDWHGNAPNKEQYESAMAQLERGLN